MTTRRASRSKNTASTPKRKQSQSLAVKYRPKTLEDVVGQEAVVAQIKGFIKNGNPPGAILLEGPTGTGKTTLAKIIANSLSGKKAEEINLDVKEVNAGADGKIADIRALINGASLSPLNNGYRCIIVDECHLLTGASASALLVPIEEPPPNTVWILATTNPEKLLPTILGRCLRLTLRPVDKKPMIRRLVEIARAEKLDILKINGGKEALSTICDFSNGYMRTAISLLESMLYAYKSGETFDKKTVLSKFITTQDVDLDVKSQAIVLACLNNDVKSALRLIYEADNTIAITNKCIFLLNFILQDAVSRPKFRPYIYQLYLKNRSNIKNKPTLRQMITLQSCMVEANIMYYQSSLEPTVLLQSKLMEYFEKFIFLKS